MNLVCGFQGRCTASELPGVSLWLTSSIKSDQAQTLIERRDEPVSCRSRDSGLGQQLSPSSRVEFPQFRFECGGEPERLQTVRVKCFEIAFEHVCPFSITIDHRESRLA